MYIIAWRKCTLRPHSSDFKLKSIDSLCLCILNDFATDQWPKFGTFSNSPKRVTRGVCAIRHERTLFSDWSRHPNNHETRLWNFYEKSATFVGFFFSTTAPCLIPEKSRMSMWLNKYGYSSGELIVWSQQALSFCQQKYSIIIYEFVYSVFFFRHDSPRE